MTGVPVKLVATDDYGSTTHIATLVISRSTGLKVKTPLEKQIPDFGASSGSSSILAAPEKIFSFDLDHIFLSQLVLPFPTTPPPLTIRPSPPGYHLTRVKFPAVAELPPRNLCYSHRNGSPSRLSRAM